MNKSSNKIVKLRRVQNNSLEIEKLKLEIEKKVFNYNGDSAGNKLYWFSIVLYTNYNLCNGYKHTYI